MRYLSPCALVLILTLCSPVAKAESLLGTIGGSIGTFGGASSDVMNVFVGEWDADEADKAYLFTGLGVSADVVGTVFEANWQNCPDFPAVVAEFTDGESDSICHDLAAFSSGWALSDVNISSSTDFIGCEISRITLELTEYLYDPAHPLESQGQTYYLPHTTIGTEIKVYGEVPEPATVGLLALGGLTLGRRRFR